MYCTLGVGGYSDVGYFRSTISHTVLDEIEDQISLMPDFNVQYTEHNVEDRRS